VATDIVYKHWPLMNSLHITVEL